MSQPLDIPNTESSVFSVPIIARSRGQLGTPLDGRYGAMDPLQLSSAIARLIPRVNLEGVNYIIGIPEGGYLPAYAFAAAANTKLILASDFQPEASAAIHFIEPHIHTHNRNKYIFGLKPGDKVVVVEDELTTGATMCNCVRALRNANVHCDDIVSIYCADNPSVHSRLAAENIRLHHLWNFSMKVVDELSKST